MLFATLHCIRILALDVVADSALMHSGQFNGVALRLFAGSVRGLVVET